MKIFLAASLFFLFFSSPVTHAHKGKKHLSTVDETVPKLGVLDKKELSTNKTLKKINDLYLEKAKPIFVKKCFDCHAIGNSLPWYSKIPGPKQLIERDIREAKKHMDMTNDFPFEGHGTPNEDLEEIDKVIHKTSMPPLRYKIMHWGSGLTGEDKENILSWIRESLKLLTTVKENK
jgi:hypothetical protein